MINLDKGSEQLDKADTFLTKLKNLLKKHWGILLIILLGVGIYFMFTSGPEEDYEEPYDDYSEEEYYEEPVYQEPIYEEEYYEQGYDEQGYDEQGYDEQGYDEQGYDEEQYYEEPTYEEEY